MIWWLNRRIRQYFGKCDILLINQHFLNWWIIDASSQFLKKKMKCETANNIQQIKTIPQFLQYSKPTFYFKKSRNHPYFRAAKFSNLRKTLNWKIANEIFSRVKCVRRKNSQANCNVFNAIFARFSKLHEMLISLLRK